MTAPTDPTKSPTFWKRWFGQNVDPKAGTFRHEVLERVGLMLAIQFAGMGISSLVRELPSFFSIIIILSFTLLGSPELLLRRSWKIGALNALPLAVLMVLRMCRINLPIDSNMLAAYMFYGAWLGLVAGLAARSLLACILGILFGQFGAWCTLQGTKYILYLMQATDPWVTSTNIQVLSILCVLPVYLCPGVAVWLGMKWSKRKPSESGA